MERETKSEQECVCMCVWERQSVSMNLFVCVFGLCRLSARSDKVQSDLVQLETNRSLRQSQSLDTDIFNIVAKDLRKQTRVSLRGDQKMSIVLIHLFNHLFIHLLSCNVLILIRFIFILSLLIHYCTPYECKWIVRCVRIFLTCAECAHCATFA